MDVDDEPRVNKHDGDTDNGDNGECTDQHIDETKTSTKTKPTPKAQSTKHKAGKTPLDAAMTVACNIKSYNFAPPPQDAPHLADESLVAS